MASIVVFAACLAAIRGNYRARLYGDTAVVKVLPVADRTPEGMAAHARRLASPEILRRASLDPRLSSLHQPLRAGDPDEVIGSSPGPQVYAHVDSVEDGTLWVDSVAEGSAAEASSIALAVANAYIADQGASRVVPWAASIPMGCEFQPKPLGEPWELAAALALAVLASALVLVVPTAMWKSFLSYVSDDWRKHGRRYLIEGSILAALVVGCAYAVRSPYVDPQTELHRLMADLCYLECEFMDRRAADCWRRAKVGIVWDDKGEEAENLKVCPYPWDTPRTPSWAEQAAVWERAAMKGRKTAARHARAAGWTVRWGSARS